MQASLSRTEGCKWHMRGIEAQGQCFNLGLKVSGRKREVGPDFEMDLAAVWSADGRGDLKVRSPQGGTVVRAAGERS